MRPILLMADSRILFDDSHGPGLPKLLPLQTEGAAYVGAANGDDPAHFEIFEAAFSKWACWHVRAPFGPAELRILERASLIFLAGGDPGLLWSALRSSGADQLLLKPRQENLWLLGLSAGAMVLGQPGWGGEEGGSLQAGLGLVPAAVAVHDEATNWKGLRARMTRDPRPRHGIGIPFNGGLWYEPKHGWGAMRRSALSLDEHGRESLIPVAELPMA